MALVKIESADTNGKFNEGLPDTPGYTVLQMQQQLDAVPKVIIEKFNDNVDELNGGFATKTYVDDGISTNNANYLSKTNITAYTPTASTHPSTKGYVDDVTNGIVVGQISKANIETILTGEISSHTHPKSAIEAVLTGTITSHNHTYSNNFTATLLASGWVGSSAPYTQTVTVTGILATDTPAVDLVQSDTMATALLQLTAYGCVSRIVTTANSITATCYEDKPVTDIPIQLKVVR